MSACNKVYFESKDNPTERGKVRGKVRAVRETDLLEELDDGADGHNVCQRQLVTNQKGSLGQQAVKLAQNLK